MDMQKNQTYEQIANKIDNLDSTLIETTSNLTFEKNIKENPIEPGVGAIEVFGYETWDINAILKGNYWGRSIFTTDMLCKMFLKWNYARQKKYLEKKRKMEFDMIWIVILMVGAVVVIFVIMIMLGVV